MTAIATLSILLLSGFLFFGESAALQKKIDAHLREKEFQGSILIAKQGKILFSKGYGLANAEYQIPNTSKTIFRIGSITKQFTAVAILQLQENGKLSVYHPISTYLPDYPGGDKITIHHLLTHTSGIPSITKFPQLSVIQRHPSTPSLVMSYFNTLPLEFMPGSECKYSDSGYIVLGAIIEAVTHAPYEKYLEEHFFLPLGMKSTHFDRNQKVIPQRAAGYGIDSTGALVNAEFIEMSFPHGAGSLASTVEDLYLWDEALQAGKLVPKKMQEQLFCKQASSTANKIAYGYGFFIDQERHTVGHMGSIEGFRAALYRHIDSDVTLIILSNQEKTNAVALEQELFSLISPSWRR